MLVGVKAFKNKQPCTRACTEKAHDLKGVSMRFFLYQNAWLWFMALCVSATFGGSALISPLYWITMIGTSLLVEHRFKDNK